MKKGAVGGMCAAIHSTLAQSRENGHIFTSTLNCFGVPGLKTSARLRYLADALNRSSYAMVCLQEVHTHAYRTLIMQGCRTCYPAQAYQQFIHTPKGGLLTLSHPPIDGHEFILFQNRGLWYTPAVMDWILHKGVLITHTHVEDTPVTVLNTHLTANYTGDGEKQPVRPAGTWRTLQIADLVNAQPHDHLVVLCGDFNIPRGSWLCDHDERNRADRSLAGDTRPTFRPYSGMGMHHSAPSISPCTAPHPCSMFAPSRICDLRRK
ncbi:MAG: endonuclease/exonuclease/phosphatase family protein [Chloroflexi bacterium]|nr:endonuclease/exonuclease/phosphatase family protein [Chloroflexota bacterium]